MPRLRDQYYFRSIDRRWRRELRAAKGRVLVFSPYITSQTADLVLGCANPASCEIHTALSAEAFAAGASSIRTLKNFLKRGFALFDVPELHAKVLIVQDGFASIGSQNLTSKAVSNLEASVAVSKAASVTAIAKLVEPWLAARTAITQDMLADLESQLPDLQKEFRKAQRKAAMIDRAVRDAAKRRDREERAEAVRRSLSALVGNGDVSEASARQFIVSSIWWLTHRHRPVPAPGFVRHMYNVDGDWRLDLGANTFLVGRAIQRCRRAIDAALNDVVAGKVISRQELVEQLRLHVRGAVANSGGSEYNGYYPLRGSYMKFGAQAIDVDDFVNVFLRQLPLFGVIGDDVQ